MDSGGGRSLNPEENDHGFRSMVIINSGDRDQAELRV
jgi:hypothetical protein